MEAATRVESNRQPVVAVAGNPNCGKTTLFNVLTGLRYKVANYPGVTVEKKEGTIALGEYPNVTIFDLPGIYSLSGLSIDEKIATSVFVEHEATRQHEELRLPEVVLAVVDASNLERNLFLLSQLIDLGIPIVLALNMMDLAERGGIQIHKELLRRALDLPIADVVASKQKGIDELRRTLEQTLKAGVASSKSFAWLPANHAYRDWAEKIGAEYKVRNPGAEATPSLFLGASLLTESLTSHEPSVTKLIGEAREKLASENIDSHSFETTSRYHWINNVIRQTTATQAREGQTTTERIDKVLTHRVWGTFIFLVLMTAMFQSIFMWAQIPMEFIESVCSDIGNFVTASLPPSQLRSLLVDGVIAGVGSVIIFVPQIAILFLFLGILEDSGYLSRAAFLMDRILRPFGLQGRSFIPLLSSFACAIPGILSTRTIPSWSDRIATIMVAPFMSCSARLPVYAVLIGAFIPQTHVWGFISLQGLVLLSMYLAGVLGACFVALALRLTLLRGKPAIFVMEMPPYRRPSVRGVFRQIYDSVTSFLKSAGTIILACSIILWFLASYPRGGLPAGEPLSVKESYAGTIGTALEPVIKPLGFNWEIGIGILASFAAREVFVSTLATVYNLESEEDDGSQSLIEVLRKKNGDGSFSLLTALSLMIFFVYACQCMSTLAVCYRETGSWKWTAFMFISMTILAYAASFTVFQGGRMIFGIS